jgi:flagellum-specific ATP synthase
LATYYGAEDLISIGAYVDGSDARIDYARKMIERMNGFLRQDLSEKVSFGVGTNRLRALFGDEKSEKIQI